MITNSTRIGVVVASQKEAVPFTEVFGNPKFSQFGFGYNVLMWNGPSQPVICLVCSGCGEIAAASATQYLIDKFHVDMVINYGVVGGLHKSLFAKKVGIVQKVVHYGFDLSGGGKYPVGRYPNQPDLFIKPQDHALPLWTIEKALGKKKLPELVCASADKFVMGGRPKYDLREQFNADICDMEAAGVVITCNRNGIRAIS